MLPSRLPSRGPLVRDLLRAGFAVVVCLVLFEFGLRVTGMKYDGSLYTREPIRFFGFRPNARGWVVYEGCNFVTINRAGLRDVDHEEGYKPDAVRIAFVGDSNSAALSVPLQDTFIKVCERQLARSGVFGNKRVETINFGVLAYNLAHEWLTLKTRVWKYHPQIVVVPLAMNGSVMNASRALNYSSVPTPFYVLENGKLVPDAETQAFPVPSEREIRTLDQIHQLENESTTFLMAQSGAGALASEWRTLLRRLSPPPKSSRPEDYVRLWSIAPPANEEMRSAWAVTEAFLEMMNEECIRHGAEFWIVPTDAPQQVDWRPSVRETLMKRAGVPDLYYPNRRYMDFAAQRNIKSVSLAPGLLQYALEHQVFLHGFFNTDPGDGHFNVEGNRVAGELLAEGMKASRYAVAVR
jgi:hypothetical protein